MLNQMPVYRAVARTLSADSGDPASRLEAAETFLRDALEALDLQHPAGPEAAPYVLTLTGISARQPLGGNWGFILALRVAGTAEEVARVAVDVGASLTLCYTAQVRELAPLPTEGLAAWLRRQVVPRLLTREVTLSWQDFWTLPAPGASFGDIRLEEVLWAVPFALSREVRWDPALFEDAIGAVQLRFPGIVAGRVFAASVREPFALSMTVGGQDGGLREWLGTFQPSRTDEVLFDHDVDQLELPSIPRDWADKKYVAAAMAELAAYRFDFAAVAKWVGERI